MLKVESAQESRRDRNKREKLERIEKAARQLFAEHGYDATTTRAIADAADVGTGTLFVYFPEKVDLLIHLYRQDLARITEQQLDALPSCLPLMEACMRIFDAVYDFYAQDEGLARSFVKEMMFLKASQQPEMFNMTMGFLNRLGGLVAKAQQEGALRSDFGPPLAAQQIFATYYWGLVTWLGSGAVNRQQLSLMTKMSLDLLMKGLALQSPTTRSKS